MSGRASFLPSSTVTVNVHVFETTMFPVRFYPGEDQVTVDVAGSGGSVTLYLGRVELARLCNTLVAAERELIARRNEHHGVRAISGPAA